MPLIASLVRHAGRARPGTAHNAARLEGARAWLLHGLARALTAGRRPEFARFLKPMSTGGVMPGGARVPGTSLELDPVRAGFVNTLLTGWECGLEDPAGHPCLHIGALLAGADAQARRALMQGQAPLTVGELAGAVMTAHEIQTGLAQRAPASPTPGGLPLLHVAQAAVLTVLLGGSLEHTAHAAAQAWREAQTAAEGAQPAHPEGPDCRAAEAASGALRLALGTLAAEARAMEAVPIPTELPGAADPLCTGALPELPGGPDQARLQLLSAAAAAFRPQQLERVNAWLSRRPESLDSRPVSELMAHLVTHAVREDSGQLALLP